MPITSAMPVYKGDPAVSLERTCDLSRGDSYTLTRLAMSAHTGTHVDAPAHFILGGRTINQLDMDALIGPARVVDLSNVEGTVTARDLEAAGLPQGVQRLLLKTKNSALWRSPVFHEDYVGLAADGAQWLLMRGVRLLGVDYMSVETFGSSDYAAHHILLNAAVVVLEGVNLESVAAGVYQLVCLPLRIDGVEGAPARAILIQE